MKKLTQLFISAVLVITVTFVPCVKVEAASEGVDLDRINNSINTVIKSVENLKDVLSMSEQEVSTFSQIFSTVTSAFSTVGSFVGPINGCVGFLKLIGLMQDGNATALANIQTQLADISDKLTQMDSKLNQMTEDMIRMQATDEFNFRAVKANQMNQAWHQFETDYMEQSMDELVRQYNVMMIDGLKEWNDNAPVKNEETDGLSDTLETADPVMTAEDTLETVDESNSAMDMYKVVIWYKCTNADAMDFGVQPEYQLQQTIANAVDYTHKRSQVARPDTYTLYADDFNMKYDRVIVLDEYFFPGPDDNWHIDTYRNRIKSYVSRMIEKTVYGDVDRLQPLNFTYKDFVEDRTLFNMLADEAVNRIVYKICYSKINASADFPTKAVKAFKEYCNHLVISSQGTDAMLKTLYLTHAFEYEIADDVNNFLDQMIVKTGSYGVFVSDVVSMSNAISESDKLSIPTYMCDTIDQIDYTKSGALIEEGRYCYVTNTVLDYAQLDISASESVDWRHRGMYYAYRDCDGGDIQASIRTSKNSTVNTGSLIGDSNALLLAYILRSNGQTMNHDYLNSHLSDVAQTDHKTLVTSLDSPSVMTKDADIRLSTYNIIGNYFEGNPDIFLNSLPKDAELEYVNIKNMITGTRFDPANVKMEVHKPLLGIAAYGENHNLWVVDESALLFGPTNVDSFQKTIEKKETGSDIISNRYYTTTLKESIEYNCLISLTYVAYAPLNDEQSALSSYIRFVNEELPSDQHEHVWDDGMITRAPDEDEPGIITYTCTENPLYSMTERFVSYAISSGENSLWNNNSDKPLSIKAIRKPRNDSTMKHFRRLLVDDREVATQDYELTQGSIIVSLKPAYLKKLSVGEHRLTIEFDDGSLTTAFTIRNVEQNDDSQASYRLPITGVDEKGQ